MTHTAIRGIAVGLLLCVSTTIPSHAHAKSGLLVKRIIAPLHVVQTVADASFAYKHCQHLPSNPDIVFCTASAFTEIQIRNMIELGADVVSVSRDNIYPALVDYCEAHCDEILRRTEQGARTLFGAIKKFACWSVEELEPLKCRRPL